MGPCFGGGLGTSGSAPPVASDETQGGERSFLLRGGGPNDTSAASPRRLWGYHVASGSSSPLTVPVPASPSLSAHKLSAPSLSSQRPPANSSFVKSCTEAQAPPVTLGDCDHVTYDELYDHCPLRGYARKDSNTVSKILSAATRAVDQKRNYDGGGRRGYLGNLARRTESFHV